MVLVCIIWRTDVNWLVPPSKFLLRFWTYSTKLISFMYHRFIKHMHSSRVHWTTPNHHNILYEAFDARISDQDFIQFSCIYQKNGTERLCCKYKKNCRSQAPVVEDKRQVAGERPLPPAGTVWVQFYFLPRLHRHSSSLPLY